MVKFKLLQLSCVIFLCISCSQKNENEEINNGGLNLKMQIQNMVSNEKLSQVDALLFNNDVLAQKYIDLPETDAPGQYKLHVDRTVFNGHLVFFSNASELGLDAFNTSQTTINDLRSATTPVADFQTTFPVFYYTSEVDVNANSNPSLDVQLKRSIARVDLTVQPEVDIVIDSCRVSNLADRSFMLPGNTGSLPDIQSCTMKLEGDKFTSKEITALMYLYESSDMAPNLWFYARINGVKNKLVVNLPDEIERNKVYKINITSLGATLQANLTVAPWDEGSNSVVKPEEFYPKIDVANSEIPLDIVSINATADTVSVPSTEINFVLAIEANVETELISEDKTITIEKLVAARSAEGYIDNRFRLTFHQRNINEAEKNVAIYIRNSALSQAYDRYFVINRKANRSRFLNIKGTITERHISYPEYADGLLGQIASDKEIANIECQSDIQGESGWIRADKSGDVYNIEGGFKPNDKEAKGQIQNTRITVTYTDGVTEGYLMSRKRDALPVVNIGGRYWAKYSLQGQAKTFADQIGFDKDKEDLWEYLKTCSNDEYYSYCGDGYKGIVTIGMKLKNNGQGVLLYPKYYSIANAQISSAPATTYCPAGYAIPTVSEFNLVFPGAYTFTAPVAGTETTAGSYTLPTGEYTIQCYKRPDLTVDGVTLSSSNNMFRIKHTDTGADFVVVDTGHQYSDTQYASGYIIFANINTAGNYRTINFNFNLNSSQSRTEVAGHSSAKTRTVRCIKTPVTYIME